MPYDVFVSYSTKDKAITDTIVSSMEQNQIRCWYAPRDIKPSDDWAKAISNAIERSKVFLLIFSGNSNQSRRVLDELNLAISQEIPVLPFRIENLEPDGAMRLHLSSRHWLDAYDPSWESHLKKLIQVVSSNLEVAVPEEDVQLPFDVRREDKARKAPHLWRIMGGIAAAAAIILIGWYALSKTKDIGDGTDDQLQAATELASLTQATPDEQCKIAFWSMRSGNPNLWLMDADGGNQTQLTFNQFGEFIGSWSLDGTEIFFYSWPHGDGEIFIMNTNGSNIRQLTDNDTSEFLPRLSPAGDKIAVYSNRDGDYEIYVMDLDGSNVQQITSNSFSGEYGENSPPMGFGWSPDGSQIVFVSDRDGDPEIFIIDKDGSNIHQLTSNEYIEYMPNWSPDGELILFVSDRFGDDEIFVMNVDGTNIRQLTSNNGISNDAAWSPDGRIAFASDRTGNLEIWIMEADGSNQQQLTFSEGSDGGPVWSPHCK